MRAALFGLVLAACTPAREVRTVSLRVVGTPTWATVTVDDITVGRLDYVTTRGVALPPGAHHLTVEAPGFFAFDKVLEAHEGDPAIRVDVTLTAVPD